MAQITTSRRFHQKNSFYEKNLTAPSLVVHINKTGIITKPINNYTYRTEDYLQQREKQPINKSTFPLTSKTTWKNVMQQRRILENDQAEIDRAISTIDSIHERLTVAKDFIRDFNIEIPVVIDKPEENLFEKLYAPWPVRIYILDKDHRLIYKAQPSETMLQLKELTEYLASIK
ncbi:unnamed protein product [Adineta steineri]|uniref:Uncharacterized protein n=1 Tax=Adineta steineri TaxID=433720 RepID=A0A816GFD5_9BILA|nr:unnamed protein product [Adineta steineri]CAF1673385.1 unnamed protein product [Adineta steineri]